MDDIRLLILLLPLIFLIHDIEEIFAVEEWSRRYKEKILWLSRELPFMGRFARSMQMSSRQFTISAAFEFGLFLLASVWASTDLIPGAGIFIFSALMAGLVLHVIVHLAQAALLELYVPGMASGLVIVLPFCLYLYQRLIGTGLLDWAAVLWTGVLGSGLILPIVLLAQVVGRKLVQALWVSGSQISQGGLSTNDG
jgi:hypothetical protein